MMSPETIRSMSRQAARESCRLGKLPFIVWPEDLASWQAVIQDGGTPRLPFPWIGDRKPRGFKHSRELFVDSSGFGDEREPAMTAHRMIMQELKVGCAYSISDQGQFQVYVDEWIPSAKRAAENGEER
jgi:hypothetical protein